MLYTVASADWSPGRPLEPSPDRPGLYRWRSEAEPLADGRALLAVAVRHDPTRGLVVPDRTAAGSLAGAWSAPALVGVRGELTLLTAVPAALVREVGRPRLRAHPGVVAFAPRPHTTCIPTTLGIRRFVVRLPPDRRKSG